MTTESPVGRSVPAAEPSADPTAMVLPLTWPETGLKPHPFAMMFRMLSGEEKAELDASLKEKGLKTKVLIFNDQILDGRNRYLGLVDNGMFDPAADWRSRPDLFEAFTGTDQEAFDLVWALNHERRHDTPQQRAMQAARRANMPQGYRSDLASPETPSANLRPVSQAEAAADQRVSERSVNSASRVIRKGTPELQQAVDENRVPLHVAEQLADLPPEEQRELVEGDRDEVKERIKARTPRRAPQRMSTNTELFEAVEAAERVSALPMVKFAAFAQSVLNVARSGPTIAADTVVAFAKDLGIVAPEGEGFVFTPEALLSLGTLAAAERKPKGPKKSKWQEEQDAHDAQIERLKASLPSTIEGLIAAYREALPRYHDAVMAGRRADEEEQFAVMDAIQEKAGELGADGRKSILKACRAPTGEVPMWGQIGTFLAEADGVRAWVSVGAGQSLHAVSFVELFPSETGFLSVHPLATAVHNAAFGERDMMAFGQMLIREGIAYCNRKDAAPVKGLVYPAHISVPDDSADDIYRHGLRTIERGVEVETLKGLAPDLAAVDAIVKAIETASYSTPKGYPKSKHPNEIIVSFADGKVAPCGDFPIAGAYAWRSRNGGAWRYVVDGADPAPMPEIAPADDAADPEAVYAAALEAGASFKGFHTKVTAAPIIEAGLAAKRTSQQIADDLGHPIGSFLGWKAKLNLTGKGEGRAAARPRKPKVAA